MEDEGNPMGEITYTMAGESLMIVDHTHVEDAYRGNGVGKKILMYIIEFARESGFRILPLCPFASSVFARNKTIRDVLS